MLAAIIAPVSTHKLGDITHPIAVRTSAIDETKAVWTFKLNAALDMPIVAQMNANGTKTMPIVSIPKMPNTHPNAADIIVPP